MGKVFTIIAIIAILYVVSSLASKMFDDGIELGDHIAVIPITGPVTTSDSIKVPLQSSGTTSTDIVNFLEKAEENDNIKAIVLEINSPGGTVVASREIVNKVKEVKKPIVTVIRDVGASGAYWVASATDAIVADSLSLTGSVGVIAAYLEFSGLFDEYGIQYEGLKAGELKDVGSPFRELEEHERRIIQKKLDRIHEQFLSDVRDNRGLTSAQVDEIKSGVYFLGEEALELNLIDELGDKEDAIDIVEDLAGIDDAKIIEYKKEKKLFDMLTQINAMSFYHMGRGIGSTLTEVDMQDMQFLV